MMRRNSGDYVKSWGAASIRGAATNAEFTVVAHYCRNPFIVYPIYDRERIALGQLICFFQYSS